jgi:molybdopterin-synthase adenylyltransferase
MTVPESWQEDGSMQDTEAGSIRGTRTTERYARQVLLEGIGQMGQRRLAECTVLILGCGALGSMQAEFLARAGIGTLVIVDRDVVELHNLQRQLLFDERDVKEGLPKATAAVRRLRTVNSEIRLEAVIADVTRLNIEQLLQTADLVLDGTDNYETRYLLNDAAVRAGKRWVYGGVIGTTGTVMAVRSGDGPCLRCICEDPPEAAHNFTCETRGIINTAVAWVAALQVTEAIKLLVGDPSVGFRLYSLDVWQGSVKSVEMIRREDCICCGSRHFEFLDSTRGSSSLVLCGRNAVQVTPESRSAVDFPILLKKLAPIGKVKVNGLVLEFECDNQRLIVFPDGRVLVLGTTDPSRARSLVAKYIGS